MEQWNPAGAAWPMIDRAGHASPMINGRDRWRQPTRSPL